jgi:hypothetical protein
MRRNIPRIQAFRDDLGPANFLPAEARASVPAPVLAAHDVAAARFEVLAAARGRLQEANDDLEHAPAVDTRADRKALEQGKDLPKVRAVDAARTAVSEANRVVIAAHPVAYEAYFDFGDQVLAHLGEWTETQQGVMDGLRERADELLDELLDVFTKLDTENAIANQLHRWNATSATDLTFGGLASTLPRDVERQSAKQAQSIATTGRLPDLFQPTPATVLPVLRRAAHDAATMHGPSGIEQHIQELQRHVGPNVSDEKREAVAGKVQELRRVSGAITVRTTTVKA